MKKNLFNTVKLIKPRTNHFDLSHDVKLSLNMGELVPIMCTECVPGDKFNISAEALIRFAPLVSPVMHRMDVTMHYFFVPNRILWESWETFITNETQPGFPTIDVDDSVYTRLHDYLGIPVPIPGESETISALPFAAYQKIYNEYYRDQNLNTKVTDEVVDGDNSAESDLYTLRNRCWEHDYFTASLPFAQKGTAVDIPLGDVSLKSSWPSEGDPKFRRDTDNLPASTGNLQVQPTPNSILSSGDLTRGLAYDPDGSLEVQATTINDLRRAFRLQEWLEKSARGGSRYVENILSFFGVRSSDKRLQRPEYITGTKSPVQISEVLNTSDTATAPQGNMAGHGISVVGSRSGHYFCEEHGYIIGIASVIPKPAYMQGIPKHFLKNDVFDFFWPPFANIGEQEVQNKEIYAFQGATGVDTFGYVPRYSEYKFETSRVAGDFRTTLDYWHLSRQFLAPPALNGNFVEIDPSSLHRIFAVTDPNEQKLYAHVYNKIHAVRPMPKYGTPMF